MTGKWKRTDFCNTLEQFKDFSTNDDGYKISKEDSLSNLHTSASTTQILKLCFGLLR